MYNYIDAMLDDIKDVASDYDWDFDDSNVEDQIEDDLWVDDSVTGNGSGEYTSNEEAKQFVMDNMDLCMEALEEFCVDKKTVAEKFMNKNWCYFDTTIRCYLLNEAIFKFLQERKEV